MDNTARWENGGLAKSMVGTVFILTSLMGPLLLIPFLPSCRCEGWSNNLFYKRESKYCFPKLGSYRTTLNWELQHFFFIITIICKREEAWIVLFLSLVFFSLSLSALEGACTFLRRGKFKYGRAPVAVLIQTLLETCRRGKNKALNQYFLWHSWRSIMQVGLPYLWVMKWETQGLSY